MFDGSSKAWLGINSEKQELSLQLQLFLGFHRLVEFCNWKFIDLNKFFEWIFPISRELDRVIEDDNSTGLIAMKIA